MIPQADPTILKRVHLPANGPSMSIQRSLNPMLRRIQDPALLEFGGFPEFKIRRSLNSEASPNSRSGIP
jgi:hypothetical protein